jgi:hypothetical protein
VDDVDDEHEQAEDEGSEGVVEELGVKSEEGVEDLVESCEVAVCAV